MKNSFEIIEFANKFTYTKNILETKLALLHGLVRGTRTMDRTLASMLSKVLVCWCAGVSANWCAGELVRSCTGVLVCLRTAVVVYWCAGVTLVTE